MFIQVQLLHGSSRLLWYQTPETQSYKGTIVQVPLKNQVVPALVVNEYTHAPKTSFDIKAIERVEPLPSDKTYQPFTRYLASYYQLEPLHFFKRIRHFLHQEQEAKSAAVYSSSTVRPTMKMTEEQSSICDAITPHLITPSFKPCVLQGVTGSGKTEIYKQLISTAIAQNKSAVMLLPEVTLALGFEHRLKQELPDITIFGFHSATPAKEKRALWQRLLDQQPTLIIGVHLPVLLPIAHLGIIIVDEEHDIGYQEKKHPKINSKEAALMRAQIAEIPIVLGSATPSFQTLHNAQTKKWEHYKLTKRFAGTFPTIKTVLLNDKKQRKQFWISKALEHAITDRLNKKEQTIIFINRRGYSFFVQCRQCSFIFSCTNCSVSLTLHGESTLTCHYCGYTEQLSPHCTGCNASAKSFIKKGIGTQQTVTILQNMFPGATIARADMDTSSRKKQWQETMRAFSQGAIDILVGTQTITKGYDFPRVTLVGILWADLQLHFPIYNAAEHALQQLIQVAGRAGRRDKSESLVIVQALDNHPIFNYIDETRYDQFFTQQAAMRKLVGYPPFMRLAELELKHKNQDIVEQEAHMLIDFIQEQKIPELQMLGPAKPPVHKIKNVFTRKLYLKAPRMEPIIAAYRFATQKRHKSRLFYTPNPLT